MRHGYAVLIAIGVLNALYADEPNKTAITHATYAVLRITQGDTVTYKVVPSQTAPAEKARIVKESKDALSKWEIESGAFLKKDNHQGECRAYPVLKPVLATVSVDRSSGTEEEMGSLCRELQQKADAIFAVVKITTCPYSHYREDAPFSIPPETHFEVLSHNEIRRKEEALFTGWIMDQCGVDRDKEQCVATTLRRMMPKPVLLKVKEGIPSQAEAEKLLKKCEKECGRTKK